MEDDFEVMKRRAGLATDRMSPKSELKRALQNIVAAVDESKYAVQRHQDPSGWLTGIGKEVSKALYIAETLQNPTERE
jgi:hypothetical protein